MKSPYPSKRNFGFGRTPLYAVKNSLNHTKGLRHSTNASHYNRMSIFLDHLRDKRKVHDLSEITITDLNEYATELAARVELGELKPSYAKNLLSSVNVSLECLRGDRAIRVKPSDYIPRLNHIRQKAPALTQEDLYSAFSEMKSEGYVREVLCIQLCDQFGLRLREACLLDCWEAFNQYLAENQFRIVRGTKGGRGSNNQIERWVPVSDDQIQLLDECVSIQERAKNLTPGYLTLRQFLSRIQYATRKYLKPAGLGTIRDRRAAYACRRYEQLTGVSAPVVGREQQASKDADKSARTIISSELGHSRIGITNAYIGK